MTYLVVGGLTALVYFGFIALSVKVFELGYRVGVSAAISIVAMVSVGYLASKFWVFLNRESLRD